MELLTKMLLSVIQILPLDSGVELPLDIWKFDLEQRKKHDFDVKWNF